MVFLDCSAGCGPDPQLLQIGVASSASVEWHWFELSEEPCQLVFMYLCQSTAAEELSLRAFLIAAYVECVDDLLVFFPLPLKQIIKTHPKRSAAYSHGARWRTVHGELKKNKGKAQVRLYQCANIQDWLSAQCVCDLRNLAQLGAVIPYAITCLSVLLIGCIYERKSDNTFYS